MKLGEIIDKNKIEDLLKNRGNDRYFYPDLLSYYILGDISFAFK